MILHFSVSLLLACCDLIVVHAASVNTEYYLRKHLFESYSPAVRPVINSNQSLVVLVGPKLRQILSVNARDQTIKVILRLRMQWVNELFKWNPRQWNGIEKLRITPGVIWTPDIVLLDQVSDDSPLELRQNLATVYPNGTTYLNIPTITTISCQLKMTFFPFDKQTCIMSWESWAHEEDEIDIKKMRGPLISTQGYINNSEWYLVNLDYRTEFQEHVGLKTDTHKAFSYIRVSMTLLRKPLYYTFNIMVPCFILMFVILVSFLLPASSGERIGLTITVLLAFTVFLSTLQGQLPTTSESVPLLSVFCVTIMGESALALSATCIVLFMHHQEAGASPLPHWVRRYVINIIGKKIGVTPNLVSTTCQQLERRFGDVRQATKVGDDVSVVSQATSQAPAKDVYDCNVLQKNVKEADRGEEEEYRLLSRILDKIFFCVFLLTFTLTAMLMLVPSYIEYADLVEI